MRKIKGNYQKREKRELLKRGITYCLQSTLRRTVQPSCLKQGAADVRKQNVGDFNDKKKRKEKNTAEA